MEQLVLMPEKCLKCGKVFDLNYDLKEDENLDDQDLELKRIEEHYCWKCRGLVN